MFEHAQNLEFEEAAQMRDQVKRGHGASMRLAQQGSV